MHLFQAQRRLRQRRGDALAIARDARASRRPKWKATVSFYTLFFRRPVGKYMLQVVPRPGVRDQRRRRRHGLFSRAARHRPPRNHRRRPLFLRRSRVSGGLRPGDRACRSIWSSSTISRRQRSTRCSSRSAPATYPREADAANRAAGPTWVIRQDAQVSTGRKSPGATGVSSPNNAGGVGDASGIDHARPIINRESRVLRPTRANAPCVDSRAVVEAVEERRRPIMPVTKVLTAGIGEADLARHRRLPRARRIPAVGARGAGAQAGRRAGSGGKASGLRGRGGAGFPTGKEVGVSCRHDKPPRYLVCNCDEAEPGTFKDHMLLEEAPHLVLEGILLGAYGIGCHHAFIYIRGEFKRGYEIFHARARRSARGRLRRQESFRHADTISR